MNEAQYILVGGFLGAGKSTAVARLARQLTDEGKRVGLITNDQGSRLVDTSTLRAQGFSVEEVAGGCFCCRFQSLKEAADSLSEKSRPDVFVAEPVGSCTDLVATVSYPLRRIYGRAFRIAPLSVLVDPVRALRILGLEDGRTFSRNVTYVYRKQLEEADFIVVNKIDLLNRERLDILRHGLEQEYPRAEIFEVAAREEIGLAPWFERLRNSEITPRSLLEVDYDIYADGEARLGWLNCTLELGAEHDLDGNSLLLDLAHRLGRCLADADAEVAHLKMTLAPERGLGDQIATVNLVRLESEPEVSHRLPERIRRGEIILNLRAEAAPETLRSAVEEVLERLRREKNVALRLDHVECFRPARPEPTHRVSGWTEA